MTFNTETSISSLLNTEVANALVLATGDDKMRTVIRSISDQVSSKFSAYANDLIASDIKGNIDEYKNAAGLFNNLNTIVNNTSSVSLNGLVNDYRSAGMDERLVNDLISMVVSSISQNIQTTLPINFNQKTIANALTSSLLPSINNSIKSVITGIVNTSYDNYGSIQDNTPSLDGLGEDESTKAVQNEIVRDTEAELKEFDSYSEDNIKKLEILNNGFRDTHAFFPAKGYKGIADTNKLAQGSIDGTIVQKKNIDRMLGAKLPDGEAFDEPVSAFHARYPYNKVTETLSGHVIEVDDTPNRERIHVYHKSGSYFEMDVEGNIFHKAKGSEYHIIDRNGYLAIVGTGNVSVGGDLKVMVSGNAHIEVTGDTTVNCFNDMELNAAGRLVLSAGEAIDMRSPLIYIEADKQLHITADEYSHQEYQKLDVVVREDYISLVEQNYETRVVGKMVTHVDDDIDVSSSKNINMKSDVDTHITSDGHQHYKSGSDIAFDASDNVSTHASTITNNSSGSINMTSSGRYNVNAGGSIDMDGSLIKLNSGSSSSVSNVDVDNPDPLEPKEAAVSEYSEAGIIEARRDFVNIPIDDVFPDNFVDEQAYTSDDVNDATVSKSVQDNMIKKGLARLQDFETTPVTIKSDGGSRASAIGFISGDKRLLSLTEPPPDNFLLSPHFNIGMLSSRAPAQPHKVKEQNGLSIGQIVYNLSEVALNILEPIFAVYPNMFVSSGFRLMEESRNSNSVHITGLAVDLQFRGVGKADYYNIAKNIKGLINNYDQLLLEYKDTGTGNPWIHIGLKNANGEQRGQASTFFNNKKNSDGLVQLA